MKVFAILALAVAACSAASVPYVAPVVPYESSVVKTDRVGGNFAYSVHENRAAVPLTYSAPYVAAPITYSAPVVAPLVKNVAPVVSTPLVKAVPVEVTKPNVEVKPITYSMYSTDYIKPVAYAAQYPTMVYNTEYKPVEYKPIETKVEFKTAEFKPEMYTKPAVSYYGAPIASYPYTMSYPAAASYPYMSYSNAYPYMTYPYNTYPYVVKAAEK